MVRKRHGFIKLAEKKQSVRGTLSLGISVLSLVVYLIFVVVSGKMDGTLSMYYGSAGVVAFLLSGASLIAAVQSMGEENSYQLIPRLAFVVSLLALAVWGGTYLLGLTAY